MTFAATHALFAYFIIEAVRIRFKLSPRLSYLAAFAALIPDFDFLLVLLFHDTAFHRAHTHTILIPIIVAIFGLLFLKKHRMEVLVLCFGYVTHVLLDFLAGILIHADHLTFALFDGIFMTAYVFYKIVKKKEVH